MNVPNAGLAHLIGQAKGGEVSLRCVKLKTLLDGKEYFLPIGKVDDIKQTQVPPFPVHVAAAYSESWVKCGEKMELTGVNKHCDLTVYGTGFVVEVVDHPSWWSKRESGGI